MAGRTLVHSWLHEGLYAEKNGDPEGKTNSILKLVGFATAHSLIATQGISMLPNPHANGKEIALHNGIKTALRIANGLAAYSQLSAAAAISRATPESLTGYRSPIERGINWPYPVTSRPTLRPFGRSSYSVPQICFDISTNAVAYSALIASAHL